MVVLWLGVDWVVDFGGWFAVCGFGLGLVWCLGGPLCVVGDCLLLVYFVTCLEFWVCRKWL